MNENPYESMKAAVTELATVAKLQEGKLLVVGCSTSEVRGRHIGKDSSLEVASDLFRALSEVQDEYGFDIAIQCCEHLNRALVMERVKADAGIDIGDTFIGMHLKHVVVPVRLSVKEIGAAHVTAARVRPKFVGGDRAQYNESLK